MQHSQEETTDRIKGYAYGSILHYLKYEAGFDFTPKDADKILDILNTLSDGAIKQTEERKNREFEEMVKSVPNTGHKLGERPWCIECLNRIQKHILSAIKQKK